MASARPLTDHERIREWAEERGATPSRVKGTGRRGDPGMIRLDFPGFSGGDSLEAISWEDWFRQFDNNNLALMVQDTTARGQASNFNKLVARKTAARGSGRGRSRSGGGARKSAGGRKKAAPRKRAAARKRPGSPRRSGGRAQAGTRAASGRKRAAARSGRGRQSARK